jgi:hypothetical protein
MTNKPKLEVTDLAKAARALDTFSGGNLREKIEDVESALQSMGAKECKTFLCNDAINNNLLIAALRLKHAAGQINTIVHAVAILLLLPELLEVGETIEYLSLGAGNTGRSFDLGTTRRVAEFKFIQWRGGGGDSRRQDNLFQDFFNLAEHCSDKEKDLFIRGTSIPLQFLNGGRAIKSVTKRSPSVWSKFNAKYGDRFSTVQDYFAFNAHTVRIIDVEPLLARLGAIELLDLAP